MRFTDGYQLKCLRRRIQYRIRKLKHNIKNAGLYITSYQLSRWEAQLEILQELEKDKS